MRKVLIVTGPTASGKTNFSIHISDLLQSSIVSADSIQVYKNLDIISGKDVPSGSKFESHSFPQLSSKFSLGYYSFATTQLWMVDVVEPTYSFNVYDYVSCSIPVIEQSITEKKLPIVVGGSGLYIRALLDGVETSVIAPNARLRHELAEKSLEELHVILKKSHPEKLKSMNDSDSKNKRRLIRAIEIADAKPFLSPLNRLNDVDILLIALTAPREVIKKRVDERVDTRLKEGALDEAKALFEDYENLSPQVKNANGYKQMFAYLKNETSELELIDTWKRSEHYNAKKQMTWLKKDSRVQWFDITEADFEKKAEKTILDWYSKK